VSSATHLTDFLATMDARTDGAGLPAFVVAEFRKFLHCGVLAHGFARVRCEDCAFERLVPFSCKGRGFCPSCGGRRMAERAAHLVEHVFPPDVPVRQWVLSVPHRLRYRLAYDHRLFRTMLSVFVRALRSAYRRQARRRGLAGGETGMVTSVQRFGGSLNLHVHRHTLVLDRIFGYWGASSTLPGLSCLRPERPNRPLCSPQNGPNIHSAIRGNTARRPRSARRYQIAGRLELLTMLGSPVWDASPAKGVVRLLAGSRA
jgi:hypothetical protein